MPGPHEGDAGWWDSIATTLDEAKFSVWSVPVDEYDATTQVIADHVADLLGPGRTRIAEVGCGIGRLVFPIADRYPRAHVYGIDVSMKMIEHAQAEGEARALLLGHHGFGRVGFFLGNATDVAPRLTLDAVYSVVTFQHNARHVCAEIVRAMSESLVPGGCFVFQIVGDSVFEDEGHVPVAVAEEWLDAAGLVLVDTDDEAMFPDWTWIIAEKPRS